MSYQGSLREKSDRRSQPSPRSKFEVWHGKRAETPSALMASELQNWVTWVYIHESECS